MFPYSYCLEILVLLVVLNFVSLDFLESLESLVSLAVFNFVIFDFLEDFVKD
jgi:hypothetical protein